MPRSNPAVERSAMGRSSRVARVLLAFTSILLLTTGTYAQQSAAAQSNKAPYLDPNLPLDQRVNDLVQRMTLDEKVSQMQDEAAAIPRLNIPRYGWWNEALHGVARSGYATVFPQAIGLAATWNADLIHRVADVISTEARAKYNDYIAHDDHARFHGLTYWSPNINIFRDPRWGRGQETYGEDPYLTGRIGLAFVTGLQGDDPKYLKTVSTPKHYAVHSGPEVLRHRFDVNVSPHDFADTYTEAFHTLVSEGKADSVMCAYNAVDGVPACASDLLLGTLRNKFGFKGYVVSDCGAIGDIYTGHEYRHTLEEADAVAVKAGTDLSCGREYAALPRAVARNLISRAEIDTAVRRLFEARFRLGMFDPPAIVPWSKLNLRDNDTPEHRQLALQTARESIVLLKNDRDFLPLKNVRNIAVVGPNADSLDVLLGNYNGTPSKYVTPLQGIKSRFKNATVTYSAGALLTEVSSLPVPGSVLRTGGAGSQPGLRAEYFANDKLQGPPAITRVDADVNFDWTALAPAPGLNHDTFSVRWTGELVSQVSGEYRLGGAADDGIRIWLENKLLVDDWGFHNERSVTTPVHLEGGHAYPIRIEYFQHNWDAIARLVWVPPNLASDAITAARNADVVIAVLGITPHLEGEEMDTSAPGFFGGDRVDIDLPKTQQQLLEALAATGKPIVLVLLNGSAIAVNWAQEHAAAILEAWYPGEEGGTAIADVLAGDYNPAGRLPVTFYKSVADLPPFQDYSMRGRTYRYFRGEPLYGFGYGLSYSQFRYSDLHASGGAETNVEVTVQNTSSRDGDEVVELYLTAPSNVDGAPLRSLQGFQRVHLKGGQSQPVTFALTSRQFTVVDADGKRMSEPGDWAISVGSQQPDPAALQDGRAMQTHTTISGPRREID
jgi:beta-glucosidase